MNLGGLYYEYLSTIYPHTGGVVPLGGVAWGWGGTGGAMATPRPTRYLVKAFARYSMIDGVYCGVDIIVNGSEQKRVLDAPKTVGINLADWCDSHAAAIFFALSAIHPEAEVAIDYCHRTSG